MAKRSPAGPADGIFTQQDRTECQQALDILSRWPADADRAAQCGLDVEPLRQMRDDLVRQLTAIRDLFMRAR